MTVSILGSPSDISSIKGVKYLLSMVEKQHKILESKHDLHDRLVRNH